LGGGPVDQGLVRILVKIKPLVGLIGKGTLEKGRKIIGGILQLAEQSPIGNTLVVAVGDLLFLRIGIKGGLPGRWAEAFGCRQGLIGPEGTIGLVIVVGIP